MLAHMPDNRLQPWEPVQHAGRDDAQDVHVDPVGVSQGGELQPGSSLPHLLVDQGGSRSGMHIDRSIQFRCHSPEGVVLGLVEEQHRVSVLARALEVVQQGANEAFLLDHAPPQFVCGLLGIVHAQRREGREPRRVFEHLCLEPVVGQPGQARGLSGIRGTPGELRDKIIMSTPFSSICCSRCPWTSSKLAIRSPPMTPLGASVDRS